MAAVLPSTATAPRRALAALSSEWIKLRSLRSMPATLLAAACFSIGLSVLVCSNYHARWSSFDAAKRTSFNPIDTSLGFMQVSMLFFGALGALAVTSEYGSGLIHGTFAATPQRGIVLAAKTLLVGAIAMAGSTLIVGVAFLAGQSQLTGPVPHAALGDPGAGRAVLGGALYLALSGLIGLYVGVLTRSTAVAVSALFGVFLVLPIMFNSLPHGFVWRHTVPYLPSNLGVSLWHTRVQDLTGPGTAALLLTAYVAGLGAISWALLRGRDA